MKVTTEKKDAGVIMLETLLSLPLYLIMLSGLFWLGEAAMARTATLNAEVLRVGEAVLRHPHTQIHENDLLWFLLNGTAQRPDIVTGFSNLSLREQVNDASCAHNWGHVYSGNAALRIRRSEWSWGIADFFQNRFRDGIAGSTIPDTETVFARTELRDGRTESMNSFIFARTKPKTEDRTGDRTDDTLYNNSIGWHTMYGSSWSTYTPQPVNQESSDPDSAPVAIKPYTRNTNYVTWSE